MLDRFLKYGAVGWLLEVAFTGTIAALRGDRSATAKTYLWMLPIYGAGGLALEKIADRLHAHPSPRRWAAYVGAIYVMEYSTGWLLKRVLQRCPWDYSDARWHLHGLIRFDYAPAWLAVGMLFEHVRPRIQGAIRKEASTLLNLQSNDADTCAWCGEALERGPSLLVGTDRDPRPLHPLCLECASWATRGLRPPGARVIVRFPKPSVLSAMVWTDTIRA